MRVQGKGGRNGSELNTNLIKEKYVGRADVTVMHVGFVRGMLDNCYSNYNMLTDV